MENFVLFYNNFMFPYWQNKGLIVLWIITIGIIVPVEKTREVFTMRAIGCVRQIDKLGRLVLPSDIRKSLNIVNGVDSVEFFVDDDAVIIKKYRPACIFCGSADDIFSYKNNNICKSCLDELRNGK